MSIEEPSYVIEKKAENYEIRKYNSTLVAETKITADFDDAGNKAFRILAPYIFGNNTLVTQKSAKSEKIAMTAPVSQFKSTDGYLVQFTMPVQYTKETLPIPNDAKIKIVEIPARKVAVYKYTGSWSHFHFEEKLKEFKIDLEKDKIKTEGEPTFARYNSPYQLWFLRRNEIWLEIKE